MSAVITGTRMGAFVVFVDEESLRHAVRLGSIMSLSDTDCSQDTTTMQMAGGRVVLIRAPLDRVLSWFI